MLTIWIKNVKIAIGTNRVLIMNAMIMMMMMMMMMMRMIKLFYDNSEDIISDYEKMMIFVSIIWTRYI